MKNIMILLGVLLILMACTPTDENPTVSEDALSDENLTDNQNNAGKWDDSQTTWDNATFGD